MQIEVPSKEDKEFLIDFLQEHNPELLEKYDENTLCELYSKFSEDIWSAQWEDNVEGQFVEWLKDAELVKVKMKIGEKLVNKIKREAVRHFLEKLSEKTISNWGEMEWFDVEEIYKEMFGEKYTK